MRGKFFFPRLGERELSPTISVAIVGRHNTNIVQSANCAPARVRCSGDAQENSWIVEYVYTRNGLYGLIYTYVEMGFKF